MRTPFLALCALLAASAASADTLVGNINGLQVGADGKIQRFRALTITDDGRIGQLIEHPERVRLANISRHVDGGGRTLLPGLIDAHGHVIDSPGGDTGLGLMMLQLDLSGTRSIEDLQRRLASYAAANPGLPWIVGRGWNQELFTQGRYPTSGDLDAVVQDRPVWLVRVDGHAGVANSAALKAAKVAGAAADPVGGRIDRSPSGALTGLFIDNAMALVAGSVPRPSDALMDRALATTQDTLLANGVTAVADMGTSARGWAAMRRLGESGGLKLRIMAYADGFQPFGSVAGKRPTSWLYGDRLRLGGVKLYADGALGSRGAWLKRPYADRPGASGLSLLTDAQMRAQAGEAAEAGFQVAIHAIGDRANAQAIATFEALDRTHGGDRRWRIEHAQVIDPADIPRLAPAGIIASMQPTHQTSDRTMAEARLDPPRLAGAYAWRTIARSGARLAFGSDFPVESPNPFPGLAAAISRQDMDGRPPGGWRMEEAVSFAQALAGFTRDAAYAGFAEEKIGSLEPGKWADFILVDRDPTAVDAQGLARTIVLETWIAGEKVWARPAANAGGERGR